jgi:CubicO group peptidase (beta-lactamase class C family)
VNKIFLIFIISINLTLLSSQDYSELSNRLEGVLTDHQTIGASIAVVQGNDVWNYSYGLKDYDRQLRVDNDTKYRIASISKIITAIGVMKLVEEGLLDLDADVSQYLAFQFRNPNFPNSEITIRHLMTHTSSIRDGSGYSDFQTASYSNNPPALEELFTTSGSYYQANVWSSYYEPGASAGWDYSNLGSGVLATIIEAVSNQHFYQYMHEILFEPLEIDYCWGNYSNLNDINDLAVLYRIYDENPTSQVDNHGGIVPNELDYVNLPIGSNALMYAPQGGLRISSLDLAKILLMYKNRGSYNEMEILASNTIDLMEETNWSGSGLGGFFTEMGLQLQKTDDLFNGEEFIGHAGEAYGLISDMYYNLERDLGIIFITNGANYSSSNVFYDLEEEVFVAIESWLASTSNYGSDISALDMNSIKLYPNVVGEKQQIKISSNSALDRLAIYNIKGQLIDAMTTNSKSYDFNLNHLASGVYFVRANNGYEIQTFKVVKLK